VVNSGAGRGSLTTNAHGGPALFRLIANALAESPYIELVEIITI
jgi:hypothetical protein